MEGYEIRPLRSGDEESLLATFNLVFAQDDPGFRPRTMAEWRWAFERNPAGQRVFVALHGGEVVAQYAALPVRMWIGGEERCFAQIVDSMVHPAHRARGKDGQSLFVETARAFFAEHGGRDRDLVHFGWPTAKALRVGERKLDYGTVRTQLALVRELEPSARPAANRAGLEVEELASFDHQVKWLWDRCADELRASAIRDAAALTWRYLDDPRQRYRAQGVRDPAGILRGLCVGARGDFLGRDLWCLADWLVPSGEPDVAELLVARALDAARASGALAMATLVPEWSPWHRWFQSRGFLAHPTPYRTVARSFHPRYDLAWLRSNWWYQLGDSDLV